MKNSPQPAPRVTLVDVASVLRGTVPSKPSDAPDGIPHVDFRPVPPETIRMVERLLDFEEADLATTRQLRREVRDVRTSTLWGMVVDLVIADTKKHIKVLKFLRARLQEREGSPMEARA